MIGAIIAAAALGVTLLLALVSLCVMFGRNLNAIDDLKTRSKNLDELPKIVAETTQLKDVTAALVSRVSKSNDRLERLERTTETRHEQLLAEIRLLRATKASRDSFQAVKPMLPPRPSRARSVELTDDDDEPTREGA